MLLVLVFEFWVLHCRVELRTQEGEKGMNSEEAERLVWAAQTIFATNCEHSPTPSSRHPSVSVSVLFWSHVTAF